MITGIALEILKRRLKDGFNYMQHHVVYVGVLKETAGRDGPLSNAQLMYLHENGVPSRNIPARPAMKIGLAKEQCKTMINECMREFTHKCVLGQTSAAANELEKCGLAATNSIKQVFGSGQLAPNAPYTIAKKGSSAPLIDIGQLRNSITYAIEQE